jgi:hypothetical protein
MLTVDDQMRIEYLIERALKQHALVVTDDKKTQEICHEALIGSLRNLFTEARWLGNGPMESTPFLIARENAILAAYHEILDLIEGK